MTSRAHLCIDRRSSTVLASICFVVLGALSGCSSAADEASERIVERAAEGAAGEGVDVETSDSGVEIRTEDGGVISTRGDLPPGFPDLALLDGEIISAVAVEEAGGGGFAVTLRLPGDAEEVVTEAADRLIAQGFGIQEGGTIPGLATVHLAGRADGRDLEVAISALSDGGVTLQYLVAPAATS